jgi:pyruvate kinase
MLKELFHAGADTFRMNFSHGTQDDHGRVYAAIRALEVEVGRPIGVLQDLQGPKIRVGTLRDGKVAVRSGDRIRFVRNGVDGDSMSIPLPHTEVFGAVSPGQELLIDDGRVRVCVSGVDDAQIDATVLVGGVIANRKGINLPGTVLDLSPLTEKDRADLEFGLRLGVDWVALSFVQKPGDLIEARGLIGDRAGLMAKIEKPAALEQIDDIIRLSDAIMVARGDLGVEIPQEEVPGRQKELVRACRVAGKPVVVATQMLESMVTSPAPTRAEASDVATAVYDGADAVMLSAESASGQFPREAVAMMDRIIGSTEKHKLYQSLVAASSQLEEQSDPHAVAAAAAELADQIGAAAIVGFTSSGTTVARIARKRPGLPILAVTPDLQVARQMALLWGAHSIQSEDVHSYEEMVAVAQRAVRQEEFARPGDLVVVVAGIPFAQTGTTNNIRLLRLTNQVGAL